MYFLSFDKGRTNGNAFSCLFVFCGQGLPKQYTLPLTAEAFSFTLRKPKDKMIQLHFGNCDMVSGLTLPIRHPSSQQLKSSNNRAFLPSIPVGQTISSSITSDLK